MAKQQQKHWTQEELSKKVVATKPMSPEEEKQMYNKLLKARINMTIGYPFFGYLSVHLKFTQDYTIMTAATDGMNFYYNPYYVKALDTPCLAFLIIHEIMHCCLDHIHRRGSRNPEKWNWACDYAVHSIIMEYINHFETSSNQKNAIRMPENCLYNSKYDNMSAEQIYSLLPVNFKSMPAFGGSGSGYSKNSKNNSSNNSDDNGNNSQDKSNNGQTPLDDHSRWESKEAKKDSSIKARTWAGRLLAANMQAAAQNPGHLPAGLARLINKLSKPQKNWRQILADYLQQEVNDFSWRIPDNRYTEDLFGDIKLPSFSEMEDIAKDLVFYIDCSGSMSQKDIDMCFSEIVGAANQFKLNGKVGFFDVQPTELTDFKDVVDLHQLLKDSSKKMQNLGGGTDCKPCFKYLTENYNRNDINVIIILSDGFLNFYSEDIAQGIPVIWVICNTDESVQPPWGKVVRLDPNEAKEDY